MTLRDWAWTISRFAWGSFKRRKKIRALTIIAIRHGTEVEDAHRGFLSLNGAWLAYLHERVAKQSVGNCRGVFVPIRLSGDGPWPYEQTSGAPDPADVDAAWRELQRKQDGQA